MHASPQRKAIFKICKISVIRKKVHHKLTRAKSRLNMIVALMGTWGVTKCLFKCSFWDKCRVTIWVILDRWGGYSMEFSSDHGIWDCFVSWRFSRFRETWNESWFRHGNFRICLDHLTCDLKIKSLPSAIESFCTVGSEELRGGGGG